MAISVATEQAANSERETADRHLAITPTKKAIGKKTEESAKPISNPESNSGPGHLPEATPTDSPRITTVSVWVPTASAR